MKKQNFPIKVEKTIKSVEVKNIQPSQFGILQCSFINFYELQHA